MIVKVILDLEKEYKQDDKFFCMFDYIEFYIYKFDSWNTKKYYLLKIKIFQ